MKFNPFRPNGPVEPSMFVGRVNEIRKLQSYLLQASFGNPTNFLIVGERGIGKTSLLNYIKATAENGIEFGTNQLKFLVVTTDIDTDTTQIGLTRKIQTGLREEANKYQVIKARLDRFWGFLQRVEISGSKINPEKESEDKEIILEEFAYWLADFVKETCTADLEQKNKLFHGILILIDEVNQSSPSLAIGRYLKQLTERLERQGCRQIAFGLAGLPSSQKVLAQSHESSPRIFDQMGLEPLGDKEVLDFLDVCLSRSEKNSNITITAEEIVRNKIVSLSQGYPHFVQQLASSTFETDIDNHLDEEDLVNGLLCENGALIQIGKRYFIQDYCQNTTQEQRDLLNFIALEHQNDDVLKGLENDLFNDSQKETLEVLIKQNLLVRENGLIRFKYSLFGLWIRFFANKPRFCGEV